MSVACNEAACKKKKQRKALSPKGRRDESKDGEERSKKGKEDANKSSSLREKK